MENRPVSLGHRPPKVTQLTPTLVKTIGYGVSTVSVLLLGVVSWNSVKSNPVLLACLLGGMAASVIGMMLRWLSYRIEKAQGE
ncbi:hypothetical protein ACM61V_16625 [Sphingomonas sp. TX0543]|uniref:hypothetical protein n=1 Tax=unclassified Sphingomonas TaxID=196159 RepID=UPI0010FA079D|nr:hypothetical protein [Sphingomonas sp. 3P27F8]